MPAVRGSLDALKYGTDKAPPPSPAPGSKVQIEYSPSTFIVVLRNIFYKRHQGPIKEPCDEDRPVPLKTAGDSHDRVTNSNDDSLEIPSFSTTADLHRMGEVPGDTNDPSPSNHRQTMEKPLPYGWEMAVAPNGKNYYIDHNTQTTTWTCPDPDIMPLERFLDEDLPAGWEVRYLTQHNRKYYVDHNTRTTSWIPPSKEVKPSLQESQVEENSALERGSKPLANDGKSEEDFRTISVGEGNSGKLLSKL